MRGEINTKMSIPGHTIWIFLYQITLNIKRQLYIQGGFIWEFFVSTPLTSPVWVLQRIQIKIYCVKLPNKILFLLTAPFNI